LRNRAVKGYGGLSLSCRSPCLFYYNMATKGCNYLLCPLKKHSVSHNANSHIS
jgi:hypothetical protein